MDRPGHDDINFFVGEEVEHSPAFGMRTLFVVGIQNVTRIHSLAMAYECDHIYFGANQSFPRSGVDWRAWDDMIAFMLKGGRHQGHNYTCTLDLDVSQVEELLDGPLTEFANFIPMVSVKMPYVRQLGYNATLKIDDRDFNATNPGVWCHRLHNLQDQAAFTAWDKYTKDTTIG